MKFKKLNTWVYTEQLEGLLLFVQRLQELSYVQTDYLEKNTQVSIWEIITEYLEIVKIIEKKSINYYNKELNIIYEELIEKISNDKISTILLGDKINRYKEGLNPSNNLSIIKQTLEIIEQKINPIKWFELFKKELLIIIKDTKKKDIIIINTNLLFEFFVYYGYQKNTIQHIINIYFYDNLKQIKIDKCENIIDFLDYFDLEFKTFEVYFKGSNFFKEIEESCSSFNMEIVEEQEPFYNNPIENKFFKNARKKKIFIKCKGIKAVDYYHATKVASELVSLISDLFTVFHHKIKPWFSDESLVYHHKKSNVIEVNNFTNSMEKLRDNKIDDAKTLFPFFLSRFGLEHESFKRFNRGVELHSLSLSTKETASQILNLWICLETLLITDSGATHISIVEEHLVKIIINEILESKINNLVHLLEQWNSEKFEEVIKKLPDTVKEDKLISVSSIFILKEYKNLAIELLNEMNDCPLLRYKIGFIIRNFQNINKILDFFENKKKKIYWNIRRVYRTRNKIVHQGDIGKQNDFIVETVHYYLDSILNSIIIKKLKFNDINSIENYLHEINLIYKDYINFIEKQKNIGITNENFIKVLFNLDY